MAKAKMYGYFKPVTPNNRAWCPKRKVKPKWKDPEIKKADKAVGSTK